MALPEEIAQAREDAPGLDAADVLGDGLGGHVEQGVARKVAAGFGQLLDRVGEQCHASCRPRRSGAASAGRA